MAAWGFHEGELAVQRKAGLQREAQRLEAMLTPADLSGGAEAFLAAQRFAVLTARNSAGELWTSPLTGAPGFMRGDADELTVAAIPRLGDPLRDLPTDQPVGLIAVNFAARRRLRINGLLTAVTKQAIEIRAEQAYGNCPQYIQRRNPNTTALATEPKEVVRHSAGLTTAERGLITAADTFFLGTTHPTRGNDASHKGGPPGFVRVDSDTRLSWPDFPGNNMFNSFGNLAVDDEAALLFIDFATGNTVHLSGTASLEWTDLGTPGDQTGRRVSFGVTAIVAGSAASTCTAGTESLTNYVTQRPTRS